MANLESRNEAAVRIQLALKVKRIGEIDDSQIRGASEPGKIGNSREVTDSLRKSIRR